MSNVQRLFTGSSMVQNSKLLHSPGFGHWTLDKAIPYPLPHLSLP
jgi:hypothetical protein